MPNVYEIAEQHRAELLRNERAAASQMLRSYALAWRRVRGEVDRLTAQIQQARDRGEVVKPAWLYRLGRLEALRETVLVEVRQFSGFAEQTILDQQQEAVTAALGDAVELGQVALGGVPEEARLIASFQRLPVEAVIDLVGNLSDGSPLHDILVRMAPQTWEAVQDQLVVGLATGLHPREIARNIRQVASVPLSRALTISRTEVLRAYRESSRRTYDANRRVVQSWIWLATLTPRTCPACWAMHGTIHEIDERLDGHPNCRCSMVPRTKSWEELGLEGIPDTRPQVPDGDAEFRRQPESLQRQVLGPSAYEAWRSGEVDLKDFVRRTESERWGTMRSTNSVSDAKEQRRQGVDNTED